MIGFPRFLEAWVEGWSIFESKTLLIVCTKSQLIMSNI